MRSNPQVTADLVTFTEEILNGKLHFLCSVYIFVFENVKISFSDCTGRKLSTSEMSNYREDFVYYHESVRFESKV